MGSQNVEMGTAGSARLQEKYAVSRKAAEVKRSEVFEHK
jgi:hypothetical protein